NDLEVDVRVAWATVLLRNEAVREPELVRLLVCRLHHLEGLLRVGLGIRRGDYWLQHFLCELPGDSLQVLLFICQCEIDCHFVSPLVFWVCLERFRSCCCNYVIL